MVYYVYFRDGKGSAHVMCDRDGDPIPFANEEKAIAKIADNIDLFDLSSAEGNRSGLSIVSLNDGNAGVKLTAHFGARWQPCPLKADTVFPSMFSRTG